MLRRRRTRSMGKNDPLPEGELRDLGASDLVEPRMTPPERRMRPLDRIPAGRTQEVLEIGAREPPQVRPISMTEVGIAECAPKDEVTDE